MQKKKKEWTNTNLIAQKYKSKWQWPRWRHRTQNHSGIINEYHNNNQSIYVHAKTIYSAIVMWLNQMPRKFRLISSAALALWNYTESNRRWPKTKLETSKCDGSIWIVKWTAWNTIKMKTWCKKRHGDLTFEMKKSSLYEYDYRFERCICFDLRCMQGVNQHWKLFSAFRGLIRKRVIPFYINWKVLKKTENVQTLFGSTSRV